MDREWSEVSRPSRPTFSRKRRKKSQNKPVVGQSQSILWKYNSPEALIFLRLLCLFAAKIRFAIPGHRPDTAGSKTDPACCA